MIDTRSAAHSRPRAGECAQRRALFGVGRQPAWAGPASSAVQGEAALELLKELAVRGREAVRVVPRQRTPTPDAVRGSHRDRVVAAASPERALLTGPDGVHAVLEGREP